MDVTPASDSNGAAAAPQMNGTTPHAASASSASSLSSTAVRGEQCLADMNAAFAKGLSLVCPPIQYPPHCRFNPVQQDAADMAEIEARLEEFFLHAKQIELLFLRDANDAELPGLEPRHELELEILNLENELNDKNDLIEKYADVIRGWEGKFKRLDHRMAPDRD
jgi:hypothetical protein